MEHAMTLESDTARKSVGGDAGKRNAMSRFRAALNAFDLPIQKPKTMMWGGERSGLLPLPVRAGP
jgi:hypothetical protein